jgi:hypothetical protein
MTDCSFLTFVKSDVIRSGTSVVTTDVDSYASLYKILRVFTFHSWQKLSAIIHVQTSSLFQGVNIERSSREVLFRITFAIKILHPSDF